MNTFSLRHQMTVALVAMCVCATPAAAQRASGPFSGLFGGSEETQGLSLRGSLFGVVDDVLVAEGDRSSDAPYLRSGIATSANGSLTYDKRSASTAFMASGSSGFRVYGSATDPWAATHSAATAFRSDLGRRIVFGATGQWAYSPYYGIDLLAAAGNPGTPFLGGFDGAVGAQRNLSTSAAVSLTSNLSQRVSATVGVTGREQRFLDDNTGTLSSLGGSARVNYRVGRAVGVHAGYGREEVRYAFGGVPRLVNDTIDVGVDYNDTLRFARRASLSFGTSTSALRYHDGTQYRLNGNVRFNRGFGRTGSAWAVYSRDTQVVAAFPEPLLSDAVGIGVSAQRGRRTHWSTSADYSRGSVGFGSASGFSVYGGSAKVQVALGRRVGMFGQYTYYHYESPSRLAVLSLLSRSSRQSVAVGLSVWVPLLNERSLSDSR